MNDTKEKFEQEKKRPKAFQQMRLFFCILLLNFKFMKQITSVQNPFIKSLVQLQEKQKFVSKRALFLIEGKREIELALKGGYELETILFYLKSSRIEK